MSIPRDKLIPNLIPALMIVAAAALAFYYFTMEGTARATRDQWADFYPNVRADWFTLHADELNHLLETGNLDEFETLAIRGAYARWRLRHQAPEAFDIIMRDYESGWWLTADREEWTRAFQQNDARWIDTRLASAKLPRAPLQSRRTENGVAVYFGTDTTAQIGSLLWIVFRAKPGQPIPQHARMLWRNSADDEVSGERVRILPMRPMDLPGQQLGETFAFEADMSWEPAWLNPNANEVKLTVELANPAEYQFVTVVGTNSPLLPVK